MRRPFRLCDGLVPSWWLRSRAAGFALRYRDVLVLFLLNRLGVRVTRMTMASEPDPLDRADASQGHHESDPSTQ